MGLQDFLLHYVGKISLEGGAIDWAQYDMKLRKRLVNSKLLEAILSGAVAAYLKFCLRTIKWQSEGLEPLKEALKDGPVILVLWHSRLILAAAHWPHDSCAARTLVDTSPIARLAGAIQRRFGVEPVQIRAGRSSLDTTLDVLRQLRGGNSLGLAADGPIGPARKFRDPPMEWARISGVPVFFYAYSTRRHIQFSSWDRMMFPVPFTKGAYVFRRLQSDIPRKIDDAQRKALKREMALALDGVQAEADVLVGLPPQP